MNRPPLEKQIGPGRSWRKKNAGRGIRAETLIDKRRPHSYQLRQVFFFAIADYNAELSRIMASVTTEYISAGGNRHPGAADWDAQTGVLAYGADNNIALWEPTVGAWRHGKSL